MTIAADSARDCGRTFERVLGTHGGERPGPTVVILGGMHGNEPAGTLAARRVLSELREQDVPVQGRVIALSGNRAALARGRRFVSRDLNRRWFDSEIGSLLEGDPADDSVEDAEQRELLGIFSDLFEETDRPVVFLDLHSTSGGGPPFSCMSDTLRNRVIALALPVPVILGLEEAITGAMLGYVSELGHVGVAFEGGQHEAEETVEQHVAAIWLVLAAAGVIQRHDHPAVDEHAERLAGATAALPRVVEVVHHHVVVEGDGFLMEPGYHSFQPIPKGALVAHDTLGEIRSPVAGRMLLPRYQGLGEDGFFVTRDVRAFWLRLSWWIRRLGLDRLARLVPGVLCDTANEGDVFVNESIASRRLIVGLLHLCGYRQTGREGGRLSFTRRRPDGAPPRQSVGPA